MTVALIVITAVMTLAFAGETVWVLIQRAQLKLRAELASWQREADRLLGIANEAGGIAVLLALTSTNLKEGSVDVPMKIINEVEEWQIKSEDGPRGSRKLVVSKRE